MHVESVAWLVTLLIVPALLGLMVLMEWLEEHFARRMVADQVAVAVASATSPEELEQVIAQAVQPLFPSDDA